ncbi:SURF1 family protein [Sulfitobacter guttiformis]|uniref:SURF1-like protein n=1 Tax=Sulfitobacter guttiformis TaxID=74349 RepID=A0A420DP54_9RHOB|nr:SURF1 family protein [Sulfitobacter guttiformis]KIN73376.1 SURF1 family protein [Sulfitobacter guttiformis KCTC 32187]RKE96041.1 surfeit locus 1 family protein [Sulfitobacter guttiformis]
MRRVLFFGIIGVGGAAILLWLGFWQMQRLEWKLGVIADIDARIKAAPIPLPDVLDPVQDAYLPVEIRGVVASEYLRVLVSQKEIGAGYRIISAMDMGGRRVLLDRGFTPVDQLDIPAHEGSETVQGNLQWPQETDGFTPEPDINENIWFARDVAAMAEALNTDEVLVVAKQTSFDDAPVSPLPVDTSAIPNDHLQYAITWFSLAAIWIAMTLAFTLRARRAPKQTS